LAQNTRLFGHKVPMLMRHTAPATFATEPVEPPPLDLEFSDNRGRILSIQLKRRPLGITFTVNQTPLQVKFCQNGGYAHQSGVSAGMVLTAIQGESISNKTYDKAWEMLVAAVKKLPGDTE